VDLPPYRPVARKLMLLAAREDVPISEVRDILRTDAAFTADVLRLANSPLIGLRVEIAGVAHAVMILGLERIKGLATTLALRSFLTSGIPTDALRACWRHNLAAAIICEKLARMAQVDVDLCYTAGLLHDIGRLALLRSRPLQYQRILDQSTGLDQLQLERSIFGMDHCEAGRAVLEQWEFPAAVRNLVAEHHRRPDERSSETMRVVYAGWQIADLCGFSAETRPLLADPMTLATVIPGKAGAKLMNELDVIAEETAFKINAVECSLL
jgi:putative nucleotidyltransferase with HDIG domain